VGGEQDRDMVAEELHQLSPPLAFGASAPIFSAFFFFLKTPSAPGPGHACMHVHINMCGTQAKQAEVYEALTSRGV